MEWKPVTCRDVRCDDQWAGLLWVRKGGGARCSLPAWSRTVVGELDIAGRVSGLFHVSFSHE